MRPRTVALFFWIHVANNLLRLFPFIPPRYWQLDLNKVDGGVRAFNNAVGVSSNEFEKTMHNICINNCHHHVVQAMNVMQYDGKKSWNQVDLAVRLLMHGKYTSYGAILKTYLPFLLLATAIAFLAGFTN
eukprot:TRINITY_DN3360_c0_g1_i3.p1 TRINITY_DN3360_c0_g1~~TRINITY_DN3360_c0_g1_i3.p1  ORF type:complete len:130 (-),score=19.74 TRINITY_DN3360_c0_g1_i3:183-572(-)